MNKFEWAAKHFDTDIDNVISVVLVEPLVKHDQVFFTANIKGINGTVTGLISRSEYEEIISGQA